MSHTLLLTCLPPLVQEGFRSLIKTWPEISLVVINQKEALQDQVSILKPMVTIVGPNYDNGWERLIGLTQLIGILPGQSKLEFSNLDTALFQGLISYQTPTYEIQTAINAIANGRTYYSSDIQQWIFPTSQSGHSTDSLSTRELQIIAMIVQGTTTKTISQRLNISIHTVNSHRKNILKKLGLASPIQLVTYALEHELL